VSTIAASPGGTPFTAMGLNIGRGKTACYVCSSQSEQRTAELGLHCQFATHHPIKLGLQCHFSWQVWCHSPRRHQYYHPIKLGLQCPFGWWVRYHPLGQHQYPPRYLGIQPCPEEEGQLFDAIPLLREH
jgi:hypothetical protein